MLKRFFKFKILVFVFFLFGSLQTYAQLLDSLSFDTAYIYTSLAEALKNPDEVYRLALRKGKLKKIPEDVFKLKNLNELDLGKNGLKEIGPEIAGLPYLQILNVERNNLENLPKEIGELKNLKKLIANQNNLYQLPLEIGFCENLTYLDLWSNNISELPSTLRNLQHLKEIDMRVISLNQEQQDAIRELVPGVKVEMSPSCNCGK